MKKQFVSLLCGGLLLGASSATRANLVPVDFLGTVQSTCGHFDVNSGCDGFGLGLSDGDPFAGQFAFDAQTADVSEFFVQFPNLRFDATDLSLTFQPFDRFLTLFGVKGTLPNGLFLTVGLTNGVPVGNGALPTSLSCADWFVCGFQINDTGNVPFESDWTMDIQGINAVNAANQEAAVFSLHTVHTMPEPSSFLLLASGIVGLWYCMRGRKQASRAAL